MSTYPEKKEENQDDASNHLISWSKALASIVSTDYRSEAFSQIKFKKWQIIVQK